MKKPIDPKLTVLIALYTEYQKPVPNMTTVTAESVALEDAAFNCAVEKLQNEELIKGAKIRRVDQVTYPYAVFLSECSITKAGVDLVEDFVTLKKSLPAQEKLKDLFKKATAAGWEALTDIAGKALAECLKGTI